MANTGGGTNLGTILALGDKPIIAPKAFNSIVPKQKSGGFVRIKWIPNKAHGRPYYYLVRSVLVNGRPRQKVVKYLGVRPPRRLEK